MKQFKDGDVVICSTGQAGTVIQFSGSDTWVLLANRDIWVGAPHKMRFPQDQADLDAAPLNVERKPVPFTRSDRD